jgi:SHAQKYF class myb-like DNA-binding protein
MDNHTDDSQDYSMRTRRRRRDYKSLEDGKAESQKPYPTRSRQTPTKEKKVSKGHIISIDTSHLKPSDKPTSRHSEQDHGPPADGSKTSGRWTAEEHRKFVEALKKYGKQWKKVEDYIQTRSGAQIRSHAQKYFLKIQKEYPDQDPYEVFRNNSPEVLEDTIFMKNRGDHEDDISSNSHRVKQVVSSHPPEGNSCQEEEKEPQENKDEEVSDFAKSVQQMLNKRRAQQAERPQLPLYNSHSNDILSIRSFFDHVKSVLPADSLPPLNSVVANEGTLWIFVKRAIQQTFEFTPT